MQVIKAYLIRQVSESPTAQFINSHLQKMKAAVESENYNSFIESLYVEIYPDGQLSYRAQAWYQDVTINVYNCYRGGWDNNWYSKGCSTIKGGVGSMGVCLKLKPATSEYNVACLVPANYSIFMLNYAGIEGGSASSALEINTENNHYENSDGYWDNYAVSAKYNIPIFPDSDSASAYASAVAAYCSSKQESDLNTIENIMKQNLYVYSNGEYEE